MDKLTTEITIEELQYRIHAHEKDLTQMWTADYFLNVQKELLAMKQAAKSPAAKIEWDGSEFSVNNVSGEFYYGTTDVYLAPVLPKQPPAELKIGSSKHVNPYYIAQCTACGWLGSSEDCLGDEDDCDCPLCYANADEVDAETAFNVMLDALNKLRASTAQPVSEPYKLPELNDELIEILGRPNFTCTKLAECLRHCGQDIKRKSEYEQAAVLHVLLNLYIRHGNDWRKHAEEAFTPAVAQESE